MEKIEMDWEDYIKKLVEVIQNDIFTREFSCGFPRFY